jgi:O-antigen ligase
MSLDLSHRFRNVSPGGVALAAAGGFAGALAFIALFMTTKVITVMLVGVTLFAALFILTRNQRLLCLWGAVLSAPLDLKKAFLVIEHMGGAGAYTIEPLDFFLVMLLAFIIRDRVRGIRPPVRVSPVGYWWGGMILLGVISVIIGPWRQVSAEEVVRMIKCYVLFFVVLNECLRRRQIIHLAAALTVCVAIQSVCALVQGAFHTDLHLQVLGEGTKESIDYASMATYLGGGDDAFRVNGLMGHPNLLGAFLSMLLPICFALLFARISRVFKLWIAGVTVIGVLSLVLTLSRTSWLTFAVTLALLFMFSFVHPRLRSRFVFARVATLGVLGLGGAAFSGKIAKRLFQSDPGAVTFRVEWNEVAWRFGTEHPIFGLGLNSFVFHLPGATKYGGIEGLNERFGPGWPAAHNLYLLTFAEQGAPGLILLIGLFVYLIYIGVRNGVRYVDDAMFAINFGCLAGIVSLTIDGLSSFFIRNPAPARVFWIVAGLAVAVDYWNRANAPLRAPGPAPRRRGAMLRPDLRAA